MTILYVYLGQPHGGTICGMTVVVMFSANTSFECLQIQGELPMSLPSTSTISSPWSNLE